MRIHKFEFENGNLELKINQIKFSNLTLLIGVSGVGKTLILKAILDLRSIANGRSLDGVKWEIEFSINENTHYLWRGVFEETGTVKLIERKLQDDDENLVKLTNRPKIMSEELFLNNKLLVERKENEIKFRGTSTPKLSSYNSVLNLFNEEDSVSSAFIGFNKIIRSNDYDTSGIPIIENFDRLLTKHLTLESIQDASLPTYFKLSLAYKNQPEVSNKIKQAFINVFNQVEDIKFEPLEESDLPFVFRNSPHLQIKEKNVSKWISLTQISSGMIKTLMQISQLFLCAEGSVILIDEFENSLGINCIDTLTENLLYDNRNLQYILTSHHPYIINAIGMEHWKLVTRKGGVISTKDAKDYYLGKSRHEAFKQLIQLHDYREGIRV